MNIEQIMQMVLKRSIGVLFVIMCYAIAYYFGFTQQPIMPTKYIIILIAVTALGLMVDLLQPTFRKYLEK